MNELQVFQNPEFGEVRTIQEGNKTLFCAKDVAAALGYSNPAKAISDHCKGVTKRYLPTAGGKQLTNFVPEGDIYRLAAKSELPGADRFERWIFDEVLPSIRKTGGYSMPDTKAAEVEAKLMNSRARMSSMWLKVGQIVDVPEYKQICASYASNVLAGHEVIPLPSCEERYYTAAEVGELLGVTGQRIGITANQHGMKTPEYGKLFFDKSRYSSKEVQTFKYNARAIRRFREVLKS